MAEETTKRGFGPKKRLTKGQAISVMVAGGILIVVPWFIPSEQGSTMQILKIGVGLTGFVILCLGSYYRP